MVKISIIITIIIALIIIVITPLIGFFIFRNGKNRIIEKELEKYKIKFIPGGNDNQEDIDSFDINDFDIINPIYQNTSSKRYLNSNSKDSKNIWGSGNSISVNQLMWLDENTTKALLVSVNGVFVVGPGGPNELKILNTIFKPNTTLSSDAFFAISNTNQLVIYDKEDEDSPYKIKYKNENEKVKEDFDTKNYYYVVINDTNDLVVYNWNSRTVLNKNNIVVPNDSSTDSILVYNYNKNTLK